MTDLTLNAFGPPCMQLNGEILEIERRKALALFVYLVITRKNHSRDALATLFWPESDQSKARAGLRRALAALKKALGKGWLDVDRETVGLNLKADIQVDVYQFQEIKEQSGMHGHSKDLVCPECLPSLVEAVELYRDDFLAGFTLRDSPEFDDWQFFEREGLRDDLASALERLALGLSAQGEYEGAIDSARRWLAMDPLHEPAQRMLMELYARSGQRAAALRQYDGCVQILEEELGALPGEVTTQLYEQIKDDQEPTPSYETRWYPATGEIGEQGKRVVNAPPQAVSDLFRDRVGEAVSLANHIGGETARLISVVGRAGMGKTALACKVLDDLEKNRHPQAPSIDGMVYLAASELSLDRLVHDVGEMLGEPMRGELEEKWAEPGEELGTKVDDLLANLNEEGRFIILLDNLEDLLDEQGRLFDGDLATFVERSLQSQSGLRLVVTSRERLYVPSEGQRRAPRVVLDEGLPLDEACEMLRDLDPDGELGLRQAEEGDLVRAAELARRMPRALEQLAFVLRQAEGTLSLEDLLEHEELFLEDALVVERLAAEVYQRLDEAGRRVVEVLSILEEPVPAQAVTYLLAPWYPDLEAESVLRRLMRGHFVSYNRMTRRYALHPVDRDFALQLLPEGGDSHAGENPYVRNALERRAASWYRGIRKAEGEWKSIDDLQPQLREFEHLLRAGEADEACELLNEIDRDYLHRWGHARLIVFLRERLVEKIKNPLLCEINYRNLGHSMHGLGRLHGAIEYYQAALDIARKLNDRANEGAAFGNLGIINLELGEIETAINYHEAALEIAREVGDKRREAISLLNLGVDYRSMSKNEKAISCFETAFTIFKEIGDKVGELRAQGNLGIEYYLMGQLEKSIQHHEYALNVSREIGDRKIEKTALDNLGVVYNSLGELEKSVTYAHNALEIARDIGDRMSEGTHLLNLGGSYGELGKLDQANSHFKEALVITQEIGDKEGEIYCLDNLGIIGIALKRYQEAEEFCRRAVILAAGSGYQRVHCFSLHTLGWALLGLNQLDDALIAFNDSASMDVPDGNYSASAGLGVVCLRLREEKAAQTAFNEAIERCEMLVEDTPRMHNAWYTLGLSRTGLALLSEISVQDAIQAYSKAREICEATGVLQVASWRLGELEKAGYGDLSAVWAVLAEEPAQD